MNYRELEFDSKLSFGGVTALFVADRLGETSADEAGYREAAQRLVKSKVIDRATCEQALARGGHVGETLILSGALGIDDWRRALRGAGAERKVEDLSRKAGGGRIGLIIGIVAVIRSVICPVVITIIISVFFEYGCH